MICSFKRLIYPKIVRDAEAGGYMIAVYAVHDKLPDSSGQNIREAKVVGYYLPMTSGLNFEMQGRWEKSKYGMQFEMESFRELIRSGREGVTAYLASGLIKGIGKKLAERIYDAFDEQTLQILDACPEELLKISGISKGKLEKIRDSYLLSRGARDIVAVLAPHGVSANRAVKIFKQFGSDALRIVREHPYHLCNMAGIGFITADAVARSMGLNALSQERISAGLIYTLKEAEARGHLCLENHTFINECVALLNTEGLTPEMTAAQAQRLWQVGELIIYKNHTFRAETAFAEQSVAKRITELLAQSCKRPQIDPDTAIDAEQRKLGIRLAAEQRQAVKIGLNSNLCIISGGPGTQSR
jgi:exodeoxyribonuclease V alpha subunit